MWETNIDSFIGTKDVIPTFTVTPEKDIEDINATAINNLEDFKSSFVNFNVTWWNFGELKIDSVNSDLKIGDIPKVIPKNIDFNSNSSEYSTIWELYLKFDWSFYKLNVKYSIIRPNENELEITFYSLDNNKQVNESNIIKIEKKSGITEYNINFKNFNWWDILENKDLNLGININWK